MTSGLKKLGDVADVQMGQSPPGDTYNTEGDGLPFFQGKAEFGEDTPTKAKWCSSPSRIAEAGDILLSVRAPVGPTNFATERCCIGRGLAAIRAKPQQCNQHYIRYYLRRFETEIAARGVGSTFAAIGRKDVEGLLLPVPSLPQQERIVKLLDEADALRKLRAQADQRTAVLIPALFHEMFGDESFPERPLIELVDQSRGISYGVVQRGNHFPGGVPLVRISDFGNNIFEPKDIVSVEPNISAKYQRTVLVGGELIVSIRGTVGRVAIVPAMAKGWNVAREVAVIPLLHDVSRPFLHSYLLSSFAQNFITGEIRGIAQRGINLEDLRRLPVPQPPKLLQEKFAVRLEEIHRMESNQISRAQRLEDLFLSILHRAFAGEL
ncbi:MAG: restriction endonuclease subunit S [Candidatus Peribacteraceae bacterium]|nr:restriction endonuclease subunit S [Candidatus Peribacteraceae bacterium]